MVKWICTVHNKHFVEVSHLPSYSTLQQCSTCRTGTLHADFIVKHTQSYNTYASVASVCAC
jgi:hypothetical protein